MTRFIIRRLVWLLVAIFGISVVVFVALRILPGDVASVMAGLNSPPERVAALRSQLGLNRPVIAQYGDWMFSLLHGDFGTSLLTGKSVSSLVATRASITFPLIVLGMAIAVGLGVPLGLASVLSDSPRKQGPFHVEWTTADRAVLARQRIIGTLPLPGIPAERMAFTNRRRDFVDIAGYSGRYHRRRERYALHSFGFVGYSGHGNHRYGDGVRHDPP
jgi:hypothetical protein